jgi:ribosomal protein S18 acetylase RimI-like enzyme
MALQGGDFWQLAHCVNDMDSPVACFLRKHDFFVEHEEWLLVHNDLRNLPPVRNDRRVSLQTYRPETAVSLFCRLYTESFSGLPWDQPFTPEEVMSTLTAATDLLFLILHGEPIGFAWVNLDAQGQALIEPMGIISPYQRQGYGRVLLSFTLQELIRRGARRAEIGAWRDNKVAIQLYQSFGFRHKETFTYLATNLPAKPA